MLSILNNEDNKKTERSEEFLPIAKYKEQIVESIRNNAFTIITAETGSGKSTQIPQYVSNYYDQVIITEPRIMAAKTLARRVAEEMGKTLGQEIGYKTGYDKLFSQDSKILFCTDGLQLIRTIFDKDNQENKVLIVDEVHEWNLNIEALVAWCKFMHRKWGVKVVIMSATMDTGKVASFFGSDTNVLNVPGSLFDVEVEERPKEELISAVVECITQKKNTLVFVPGKKEISQVIDELRGIDATVLPLHGEMDWEEQKKCFYNYSNPKVIVATNVAQTSITIPDIDVVVDTGEARISVAENGIQGLFLKDISYSDIMQRKGRAGRTKNGKYILCSDTPIESRKRYSTPEIQRSILDRVVLQLAAIGIDAEEMEFYHQPKKESIVIAKKELMALGAIDINNQVTELGQRMAKIPVSVQLARMIIESEKYGCVEQVLTIAAIMEMGGLLSKEVGYYNFTRENDSDLLAELDVWNKLQTMDYIDFKEMGIKKKIFFKVKEHIKKLREALYGIVEITSNDNDRMAILKSCLSGLVSRIYVREGREYIGDDGINRKIDKRSCVSYGNILIGFPKNFEYEDHFGYKQKINLISFVSVIEGETLVELCPDRIKEETEVTYSNSEDAVLVTTTKLFKGFAIERKTHFDYQHPRYEELKQAYEKRQAKLKARESLWFTSSWERNYDAESKQKTVMIDGKSFDVSYYWGDAIIWIDEETLFTTDVKNVFLDNGRAVKIRTYFSNEQLSIPALRNMVENKRLNQIRKRAKEEYEAIKVTTLKDVLVRRSKLGKIKLTMNNGGYGNTPICAYGCISLRKNTVFFKLVDDEELANSNTKEALQYLFLKEIEKRFGESKFSHQAGKKKKVLTDSEKEIKSEFDSLVREAILSLTLENAQENLDFLEEYYQELMG